MSNWGFVYCMANDCMPGIYKIGYTNRTPNGRADELSAPSGVPFPFEVLFYLETKDAPLVESMIHVVLDQYRVSCNREFFKVGDEIIKRTFIEQGDGRGQLMESQNYQGMLMEREFMASRQGRKSEGMVI